MGANCGVCLPIYSVYMCVFGASDVCRGWLLIVLHNIYIAMRSVRCFVGIYNKLGFFCVNLFVYMFVLEIRVSGLVLCKFSSVRKIDATGLNSLKFSRDESMIYGFRKACGAEE